MMKKKYHLMFGVVVAILFSLSLGYISSCTKVGSRPGCDLLQCLNGGYCDTMLHGTDTGKHNPDTARCYCPLGYTGQYCQTAKVSKYFGNWSVVDTIKGTDSTLHLFTDSAYTALLDSTSTPTTFFLNNFLGNNNYNQIACLLDTTTGYTFVFDTSRGFRMTYDFMIVISGSGTMTPDNNTINASFIIHYKNQTWNWEIDTVQMTMRRM